VELSTEDQKRLAFDYELRGVAALFEVGQVCFWGGGLAEGWASKGYREQEGEQAEPVRLLIAIVRLRSGRICLLSIHQTEYYVRNGESRGVGLVGAVDEVLGEGFEGVGGGAEGGEGFEGVGDELLGVFAALVDAVDGGPGGLDAGGVLACGLA
jgi:hypothetical protein